MATDLPSVFISNFIQDCLTATNLRVFRRDLHLSIIPTAGRVRPCWPCLHLKAYAMTLSIGPPPCPMCPGQSQVSTDSMAALIKGRGDLWRGSHHLPGCVWPWRTRARTLTVVSVFFILIGVGFQVWAAECQPKGCFLQSYNFSVTF